MKHNNATLMLVSAFIFLSTCASSNACCPLCLAPQRTWAETIHEAEVVVLGKLISRDEGAEDRKPSAEFEVVHVHKSTALFKHDVKTRVRIHEFVYGETGDLFLLTASLRDANTRTLHETFATTNSGEKTDLKIKKVSATESKPDYVIAWDVPVPASMKAWKYVTAAPSPDHDTLERLNYFLPYLENSSDLVASDAWGEFAKAEYGVIKKLSPKFSATNLRTWISNSETGPERLSLYGLMLGMCGGAEDAEFLRQQIGAAKTGEIQLGHEGLMGGLLVLAGENGLRFLEETRLHRETAPTFEILAAVQAIQFLWNHEPERIAKERMRKALHPLLNNESMREIVIIDLARWQDWSLVSKLPDVYSQCREDDSRTTAAIVGYLLAYLKTNQVAKSDGDSDDERRAKKLLEVIRADNPRLVRTQERQFD